VACGVWLSHNGCGLWQLGGAGEYGMTILQLKQLMLVPFGANFQEVQKCTFWQDVHFCTS
jgi:hypothetical protein